MSFEGDLKAGQDAETTFHAKHPWLIRADGKLYDFETPKGKRVELKSEKRTTAETPNLALELNSSGGRLGCIQNAYNNDVHYLVYTFADGKQFTYNCTALFIFMIANAYRYRQVHVSNGSYLTTVVLIPRADLHALEVLLEN